MSRRVVLWSGFLLVHVAVAVLGYVLPTEPMGDVYRVYEPWSDAALSGNGIVGITWPWVYPQLALVPMLLAHVFDGITRTYTASWAVLVTVCDAPAFALLVGRGRSAGRSVAAWFWLGFMLLLGPAGMYRLDAITVPLAIAGCLWLVRRPLVGSILLSVATWMKVWPAALLAAALIAVRRRFALIGGAVLVSAITVGAVALAGGGAHVFSFIGDQTGRALQLEAPVSGIYVWATVLRVPGASLYYSTDMLTYEATGPHVDVVIAVMTPLLALAVGTVAGIGAVKAWRGASFAALFPDLALSLVLAFIFFNKVGSPQYYTWIVAPLVMGLVVHRRRWRRMAVLGLVIAALTQLMYPLMYMGVLTADPMSELVLTVRNLAVGAMLVWSVVRLVRVRTRGRMHSVTAAAVG